MKKLVLLAALLPVLSFAQEANEAFVFAVVPRIQSVTTEVRECTEVSASMAAEAVKPAPGAHPDAMAPQWLVAENGTAKIVAPEETVAAQPLAGESCRLTERQDRMQDGWQVFLRFQNKNVNTKVASNPPQVGEYVAVTYNTRGQVVLDTKAPLPAPAKPVK